MKENVTVRFFYVKIASQQNSFPILCGPWADKYFRRQLMGNIVHYREHFVAKSTTM